MLVLQINYILTQGNQENYKYGKTQKEADEMMERGQQQLKINKTKNREETEDILSMSEMNGITRKINVTASIDYRINKTHKPLYHLKVTTTGSLRGVIIYIYQQLLFTFNTNFTTVFLKKLLFP